MSDDFKRHIEGFHGTRVNKPSPRGHGPGQTCPCCRETGKKQSRKLARTRLRRETETRIDEASDE